MPAIGVHAANRGRRRRAAAHLLGLVQFGHAAWLFGNLYEAIVKVPDRLAAPDPGHSGAQRVSPLGPGSPVRYYAAAATAAFPPQLAAVLLGWDSPRSRRWLVTSAACSITAAAATGYLVRAVNLKLFFNAQPVNAHEREILLRTWYRVNAVRLVLTGASWMASAGAKARLLR
jgi:hypothetical protein